MNCRVWSKCCLGDLNWQLQLSDCWVLKDKLCTADHFVDGFSMNRNLAHPSWRTLANHFAETNWGEVSSTYILPTLFCLNPCLELYLEVQFGIPVWSPSGKQHGVMRDVNPVRFFLNPRTFKYQIILLMLFNFKTVAENPKASNLLCSFSKPPYHRRSMRITVVTKDDWTLIGKRSVCEPQHECQRLLFQPRRGSLCRGR